MTDIGSTRDRLVRAAFELFSTSGYRGTSVAEIEEAAGLSPGAGGFYRHFDRKAEILEAVVGAQIQRTVEVEGIIDEMTPLHDIRAEGLLLLRRGMEEMRRSQNVLLILAKVSDEFPELLDRFHEQVIDRSYEAVLEWITEAEAQADLQVENPTALMVAVVGAMANYRKTEVLFDRPPADVDEETFVRTLMDVIMRYGTHDVNSNDQE